MSTAQPEHRTPEAERLRAEQARELATLTQRLADARLLHERAALSDVANRQLVIDLRAELAARDAEYRQQMEQAQQTLAERPAARTHAVADERQWSEGLGGLAVRVWRACKALLGRLHTR